MHEYLSPPTPTELPFLCSLLSWRGGLQPASTQSQDLHQGGEKQKYVGQWEVRSPYLRKHSGQDPSHYPTCEQSFACCLTSWQRPCTWVTDDLATPVPQFYSLFFLLFSLCGALCLGLPRCPSFLILASRSASRLLLACQTSTCKPRRQCGWIWLSFSSALRCTRTFPCASWPFDHQSVLIRCSLTTDLYVPGLICPPPGLLSTRET